MNSKKTGQKLYLKAKKIIPGGNMFLSKRPEMHHLIIGHHTFLKLRDVMFGI